MVHLNGIHFVITGRLSKPRKVFASLIESAGGTLQTSVSGKTDYLVVGSLDRVEGGVSNKLRKAGLGGHVKVISEKQLMDMVGAGRSPSNYSSPIKRSSNIASSSTATPSLRKSATSPKKRTPLRMVVSPRKSPASAASSYGRSKLASPSRGGANAVNVVASPSKDLTDFYIGNAALKTGAGYLQQFRKEVGNPEPLRKKMASIARRVTNAKSEQAKISILPIHIDKEAYAAFLKRWMRDDAPETLPPSKNLAMALAYFDQASHFYGHASRSTNDKIAQVAGKLTAHSTTLMSDIWDLSAQFDAWRKRDFQ